jgi:peptide/nickel transport system permease protein
MTGGTAGLASTPAAAASGQRRWELPVRVAQRLGSGLVVLWLAVTAAFFGLFALPGRIEDILAGDQSYPGLQEAIARQWGLNTPVIEQYLRFLGRLLHGDLGTSYVQRQPVSALVLSGVWPTMQLALAAAGLAAVLALTAAILTSGRFPLLRRALSTVELVATSVPVYWVGLLLLLVFSFQLHAFPVAGGGSLRSLVLPACTLALAPAAVMSQVLRGAVERTLGATFVVTVRARGVGETAVRLRHALRHALVPLLSLSGSLVGTLLGGAVITEQIFGRPGLGATVLSAVQNKDVPVVLAVVLIVSGCYVLVSTLIDIGYLSADPRLRAHHGA